MPYEAVPPPRRHAQALLHGLAAARDRRHQLAPDQRFRSALRPGHRNRQPACDRRRPPERGEIPRLDEDVLRLDAGQGDMEDRAVARADQLRPARRRLRPGRAAAPAVDGERLRRRLRRAGRQRQREIGALRHADVGAGEIIHPEPGPHRLARLGNPHVHRQEQTVLVADAVDAENGEARGRRPVEAGLAEIAASGPVEPGGRPPSPGLRQ